MKMFKMMRIYISKWLPGIFVTGCLAESATISPISAYFPRILFPATILHLSASVVRPFSNLIRFLVREWFPPVSDFVHEF